jgi:hypothetical protein
MNLSLMTRLLTVALVVALIVVGGAARADTLFHVRAVTVACAAPAFVHEVLDDPHTHSNDPTWLRSSLAAGRCVTITPRSRWRVLSRQGDLAFMAYVGTVGAPGSYYFLAKVLFDDNGANPTEPVVERPLTVIPNSPKPRARVGQKPTSPPPAVIKQPEPALPAVSPPMPAAARREQDSGSGAALVFFIPSGIFVVWWVARQSAKGGRRSSKPAVASSQAPAKRMTSAPKSPPAAPKIVFTSKPAVVNKPVVVTPPIEASQKESLSQLPTLLVTEQELILPIQTAPTLAVVKPTASPTAPTQSALQHNRYLTPEQVARLERARALSKDRAERLAAGKIDFGAGARSPVEVLRSARRESSTEQDLAPSIQTAPALSVVTPTTAPTAPTQSAPQSNHYLYPEEVVRLERAKALSRDRAERLASGEITFDAGDQSMAGVLRRARLAASIRLAPNAAPEATIHQPKPPSKYARQPVDAQDTKEVARLEQVRALARARVDRVVAGEAVPSHAYSSIPTPSPNSDDPHSTTEEIDLDLGSADETDQGESPGLGREANELDDEALAEFSVPLVQLGPAPEKNRRDLHDSDEPGQEDSSRHVFESKEDDPEEAVEIAEPAAVLPVARLAEVALVTSVIVEAPTEPPPAHLHGMRAVLDALGTFAAPPPARISTPIPAPRSNEVVWHQPGVSLAVAGVIISDGMLYIGPSEPFSTDANSCAVDPSLPVAPIGSTNETAGYWPCYRTLSPGARRTYLNWLAAGRSDPAIDMSYVLLFFYGLERRLIVDNPNADEVFSLVSELHRLKAVYGLDPSFARNCDDLLEAMRAVRFAEHAGLRDTFKPDLSEYPGSFPDTLRVVIAQKVVAGEPLSFELSAAGVIGLRDDAATNNQYVLSTARAEYTELLRIRFASAFPDGFLLRDRKNSMLRLDYTLSATHTTVDLNVAARLPRLPNPRSLTWKKLRALSLQAQADLQSYASLVAYHPERVDSLAAYVASPVDLRPTIATDAIGWLEQREPPIASVQFGLLAKHAIGSRHAKWTIRHHRFVAETLAALGWAMEPDPSNGSVKLSDETEVFLSRDFDQGAQKSLNFEPAVATAFLMAEFTRAFPVDAQLEDFAIAAIAERFPLEPHELLRLRGRLRWLAKTTDGINKAKRMLETGTTANRELAAVSVAAAAMAARLVCKAEVARLETLFDKLKVPRQALYAALHNSAAAHASPASSPVKVGSDEPQIVYRIPAPPKPTAGNELDKARLEQVRRETAQVSSVLADIFIDEQGVPTAQVPPVPSEAGPFSGLDAAHAALVERLIANSTWPRSTFEATAREAGLMPDGCLEVINEWAFDKFDGPLIEDGDTLIVDVSLITPLLQSAGAA